MPIDPSAVIAPMARVHPDAQIGPRTFVGEYCVIEPDVSIGAECRLEPHVYIKRWTTLGDRNEISAGTVLGTDPLDKAFTGERSYLRIGSGNRIREHYTISRGTEPESATEIGDDNYIMTSGHIAHNCRIGNNTVICSCALVAGHVGIEDQAFVSGGVVIHQFSHIGRLAMIGGNSRVNSDAPPFFLYSGFNVAPGGAEAGRIHTRGNHQSQESVCNPLPPGVEARGCVEADRERRPFGAYPAPGAVYPAEQARNLPRVGDPPALRGCGPRARTPVSGQS
jgi:UDP-N-acetylglucosamine acyltransferase